MYISTQIEINRVLISLHNPGSRPTRNFFLMCNCPPKNSWNSNVVLQILFKTFMTGMMHELNNNNKIKYI